MPNLNQSILNNLEFQLPPLSEQKNIINKIESIESQIVSSKLFVTKLLIAKKAILHRELIEDDKQESTIKTVEIGHRER